MTLFKLAQITKGGKHYGNERIDAEVPAHPERDRRECSPEHERRQHQHAGPDQRAQGSPAGAGSPQRGHEDPARILLRLRQEDHQDGLQAAREARGNRGDSRAHHDLSDGSERRSGGQAGLPGCDRRRARGSGRAGESDRLLRNDRGPAQLRPDPRRVSVRANPRRHCLRGFH